MVFVKVNSLVFRSLFFKGRNNVVYASSEDRFKSQLDGIQVELQATDSSEMSLDIVKGRTL